MLVDSEMWLLVWMFSLVLGGLALGILVRGGVISTRVLELVMSANGSLLLFVSVLTLDTASSLVSRITQAAGLTLVGLGLIYLPRWVLLRLRGKTWRDYWGEADSKVRRPDGK